MDKKKERIRRRLAANCQFVAKILIFQALVLVVPVAQGRLVYTALDSSGYWQVYGQEEINSNPRLLSQDTASDASSPRLAWDGERVAYEVPGAGLRICTTGSNQECSVFRVKQGAAVRPFWNPAGHLLFVHYLADASGEKADLDRVVDTNAEMANVFLAQTGIQDYADVSADGRQLAYTSAQTVSLARAGVQVVQQVWVMDLVSGQARILLPGTGRDMQPAWSPNGQQIAFASNRSGEFEIWVADSDGTNLRRLTVGSGPKTWPTWSPDGRAMLFNWFREGNYELWLMDADGGNPRRFQPSGPLSSAQLRDADWR